MKLAEECESRTTVAQPGQNSTFDMKQTLCKTL